MATHDAESSARNARKKPFYRTLWGQVLIGVALGIILGYVRPQTAIAMKPLGDAFIRVISMIITLVIFCTIVTGIAGMGDMKKVGRVGGKALLYFEVVSTIALLIGLVVGNLVQTGAGFNANPATLNAAAVTNYAGAAKTQTVTDFLMHIIPTTVVDAFARGDILEVVFISVLFGLAMSVMGKRVKPLVETIEGLTQAVFGVVSLVMKAAPIGAFGAMAFTIGQYRLKLLGPLPKHLRADWIHSILFVLVVLGAICWASGFGIIRFLSYFNESIVLCLTLSSSEPALPTLMEKMDKLGCSKALVGLVVPTGYTFNTDGSSIYMTLAALFVAQATNIHLTIRQQLPILPVAVLTSKAATGVKGAAFIALVGTLMVIPTIPVAGMALILGVDRFMSMARATTNMIANGVATVVLARWEHELDRATLRRNLGLPFAVATAPLEPAPARKSIG